METSVSFLELEEIIASVLRIRYDEERLEMFGGALGESEQSLTQRAIAARRERFEKLIVYLEAAHDDELVKKIRRLVNDSRFDEIRDQIQEDFFPSSLLSESIEAYIGFCASIHSHAKEHKNPIAQKIAEHFHGLADGGSLQNVVDALQWSLNGGPQGLLYFANLRVLMLVRREFVNGLALRQLLEEREREFEAFKTELQTQGVEEL